MGVTMTMPEGHAILDSGAALDCIGGHHCVWRNTSPRSSGKIQRFKFGGDGDPVEASFAVTLPVQIGGTKTWIEAFVVPGSTPHLISRRCLSQHRCVVNFDPNNLCLESPEFGSVPLVLHSSGHLLLALVSSSNSVDQYTVMIDHQNFSSSGVNNFQRCDEQIMDSLQSRNQVVDKRAEPDEKRAGNSPLVRHRSDHPVEFAVHLDDPNEEITEHWQDGLHERYQGSVKPNRISRDVSEMRSSQLLCPCLKRRSVSIGANKKASMPPVAVLPQKTSVGAWFKRCFRVLHLSKIAKTTRMMWWYLLVVGIMSCLDRAVHVPHGADACLTNSSFVDTFHVDSWNSSDNLEQHVQRKVRRNRVDWVQVGDQVTNPDHRDTAVRLRGYKIRHVQQHSLNSLRLSEVASKAGRVLETDYSRVSRAEQEITISSGLCCRLGSGPASSWWKSVSDVSLEMERADELANSICDQ